MSDDTLTPDMLEKKGGRVVGPPVELLREVKELRNAEIESVLSDPRPQVRQIESAALGGTFLFRRWPAHQKAAMESRLRKAGVTSMPVSVQDCNRGHLIKAIQIGLTHADNKLAFPGDVGFNRIGDLNNLQLESLANEALEFNEVFQ